MRVADARTTHPAPISMAIGEPAEALPDFLVEAGCDALRAGTTRYAELGGHPALRRALAIEQSGRDGIPRTIDHAIVTAGAKPALLDALRLLVSPRQNVLVFAPYWPTFIDQIKLVGATPVVVPPTPDGVPSASNLESCVTSGAGVLILNSPNNPTGHVFDTESLMEIARVVRERELWTIADQAYIDLTLTGTAPTILSVAPDLFDSTVVIESFSKRFSMTGLRLGAAFAPPSLIEMLKAVASSSTTHPSTVAQAIGIEALEHGGPWRRAQIERHVKRQHMAVSALSALDGIQVLPQPAAPFLFPNVEGLARRRGFAGCTEVAGALLQEMGLRLVPGSAFGAPGALRLSYSLPEPLLQEALDRLARWARGF